MNKISESIKAVGVAGNIQLLTNTPDKEDGKALTLTIEDDVQIGELHDNIQTPLKFNAFEPLDDEASANVIAVLNQKLPESTIANINDFLK